ncbi:MAG: mechanosensitive ion channel [Candidatus Mariimomonas ferrooxydans]
MTSKRKSPVIMEKKSRSIMSNILARYYINQLFSLGDEVLLSGQKGKIVKITPVSVMLKTEKGDEVHIPNEKIIKEGSGAIKAEDTEGEK